MRVGAAAAVTTKPLKEGGLGFAPSSTAMPPRPATRSIARDEHIARIPILYAARLHNGIAPGAIA